MNAGTILALAGGLGLFLYGMEMMSVATNDVVILTIHIFYGHGRCSCLLHMQMV